jgi:hypothetical protein
MDVTAWLLDSDPSIRWQVMRDLIDEPDEVVATERSRIAQHGWGARLLALQAEDGQWGGGTYSPKWISTTYTLLLLRDLGVDPAAAEVASALRKVRDGVSWGRIDRRPFFAGSSETCILGMLVALAAYYRESRETITPLVHRLLGEQLDDGGWNCEAPRRSHRASFNTTIIAVEALAEVERTGPADAAVVAARARGEEYLLERRLFRSRTTGEVVDPAWLRFSFPPRWHYDVLRGLDHLRDASAPPDERCAEAVELLRRRRRRDGRWPLQHTHRGRTHFEMEEGDGKPSRWNTLRAMRVLRWYDGGIARRDGQSG